MKRLLLVGAAVAAILAGPAHAQSADKLLNASYDVARELFVQVNEALSPPIRASPSTSRMPAPRSRRAPSSKAWRPTSSPSTRSPTSTSWSRTASSRDDWQKRFRQQRLALLFAAVLPGARRQSEEHQGLERSRARRREGDLPQSEDLGQCALHLSGGHRLRQGGLQGDDEAKVEGVRQQAVRQRAGLRHRRPRRDHDLRRARDRRRADHLRIRDDAASARSSATTSSSRSTPSVSLLAEFPVAIVDKVVDEHGSRDLAKSYLDFLYTPEGQKIARRERQPRARRSRRRRVQGRVPRSPPGTVEDVFGGWDKVQAEHFAAGALLDQIYGER